MAFFSKADNVVVSSYARDNSNTEANIYLDEESIKIFRMGMIPVVSRGLSTRAGVKFGSR